MRPAPAALQAQHLQSEAGACVQGQLCSVSALGRSQGPPVGVVLQCPDLLAGLQQVQDACCRVAALLLDFGIAAWLSVRVDVQRALVRGVVTLKGTEQLVRGGSGGEGACSLQGEMSFKELCCNGLTLRARSS